MRKAIEELVRIPDDGTALALAAQSVSAAGINSWMMLGPWPKAADPDSFCATLLAPAPVRDNRTFIRLRGMTSLTVCAISPWFAN